MGQCLVIGGKLPSIVFTETASDGVSATTHTFTGIDIGTASARRLVVVAVGFGSVTPGSSLTIAGVSATELTGCTLDSGSLHVRMFALLVPTGTTATIVLTQTSAGGANITVFALYDLRSTTPVDTATDDTGNPIDLSLDVSSKGVACGLAEVSGGSLTWTGMTEQSEAVGASGAIYTATAAVTPLSVTVTATGTPSFFLGCAASFR